MAPPDEKKGNRNSMGFFSLFMNNEPRLGRSPYKSASIGRTASGRPALIRVRAKPKTTKKHVPSSVASTRAERSVSSASEGPPSFEYATSTGAVDDWTPVEDAALLGMKALRKSWGEISETLPGKDLDAVKKRYSLLYEEAADEYKTKEDGAKSPNGVKKDNPNESEEKGSDVAKKAKGTLGDKTQAKEKTKEGSKKGAAKLSSTKNDKDKEKTHTITPVDISRLEPMLQYMNKRHEEKMWVELSSRYFDAFGRRFEPKLLEEKIGKKKR